MIMNMGQQSGYAIRYKQVILTRRIKEKQHHSFAFVIVIGTSTIQIFICRWVTLDLEVDHTETYILTWETKVADFLQVSALPFQFHNHNL